MVTTTKRLPTTDMQVTSIRLETDLKERLKELSGVQGYQSLIRDILWDYVERHGRSQQHQLSVMDIRATLPAIAQQCETCAITGRSIAKGNEMLMGLTVSGGFVPLTPEALKA